MAIALDHITAKATIVEFYRLTDEMDDQGTKRPYIGGELNVRGESLSVRVQKLPAAYDPCDGPATCEQVGSATVARQAAGEDVPGQVTVFVDADGERRSADIEGGPLFVSVDELRAIVTDPAFALHTTQAAVDAGKKLKAKY